MEPGALAPSLTLLMEDSDENAAQRIMDASDGSMNHRGASQIVFSAEDVKRTLQSKSTERILQFTSSNISPLSRLSRGTLLSNSHSIASIAKQNQAASLARNLLTLCQCSRCEKPVLEPVTLPCGHSTCLSCIGLITKARSHPSIDVSLPCSTHLPPRLPMSSTTVPCSLADCVRGAIGRGIGCWSGHNAIYGSTIQESAFENHSVGEDIASIVPLDGFVGAHNQQNDRLAVVPAQSRSSFSTNYAISKYDLDSCLITQEVELLRPDVTLSKAVELLRRYNSISHYGNSSAPATRHRFPRYPGDIGASSSRRSRSSRHLGNRRHTLKGSMKMSSYRPAGDRTPINPIFHAALGLSEEGRETGAVGGIRAVLDSSDEEEEDDYMDADAEQYLIEGIEANNWHSTSQDDVYRYPLEADQDDEIGGAFARQYTPDLHDTQGRMLDTKGSFPSSNSASTLITPESLNEELQDILECQLCYMLLYQPLTTPCGHTFCRTCFARSLDHSNACPLCRSEMPSFSFFQDHPTNKIILALLTAEWENAEDEEDEFISTTNLLLSSEMQPKELGLKHIYEARQITMEREARELLSWTPLFVLTLAFPHMPTILHIFEPRYRLMIRRCLESGQARFGMVMYTQETSGPVPGMSRYGTMLEIKTVQMLPDGRSMIETVGSYRFRVIERGSLDGYTTGRIERIEDVSSETEEHFEQASFGVVESNASSEFSAEAREAQAALRAAIGIDLSRGETQPLEQGNNDLFEIFGQKTIPQLIEICLSFIETIRLGSAPWLIARLKNTYGPTPDVKDLAAFGYWMALVMPIDEHEKAKLLPIRSPRLRLRIVVYWIEQLRQTWWFNHGCNIQ